MHLVCTRCRTALTRDCRLGADGDYDRLADQGAPSVPAGIIVRRNIEDALTVSPAKGREKRRKVSAAGAFSINPADLCEGALKPSGIDNGCCGSDGLDGPNRSCACGQVLGTQWSDCWTQAEVRFEPDRVAIVD